jgi:hypothetical protein
MNKNTKMENYKGGGESKQEDPPEYKVITEENMYEFIIWCNQLKPPSIEVNQFNMMLQTNIREWIYKNNITWQYAYTTTLDTILEQKKIAENMDEISHEEKIRPTSIQDRRKLFAERAEERMSSHLKKKSRRKPHYK